MVDFRYHLVSLIAVFMALGVGIILGAGPLQNSIGSVLTNQVDSLRESRNEAWAQAEEAERESQAYREGLESLTTDMITGSLDGQAIVIVALPGASDDAIAAHSENLMLSGAEIQGVVEITDSFFSPATASYRNALSGQLGSYVETSDNPMETLVAGLELILMADDESAGAATLLELYQSSDNPLIEVRESLVSPSDAILVVGPTEVEAPVEGEEDPDAETILANKVEFMTAIETPAVLVSTGDSGTLLDAVRADDNGVSTVDSPEDSTSFINVPFALTQELSGATVAWGITDSAELVLGERAELENFAAADPSESEEGVTEGEATEGDSVDGDAPVDGETVEGEAVDGGEAGTEGEGTLAGVLGCEDQQTDGDSAGEDQPADGE